MTVCFQPMSYTELSMEEERSGLMALMKCRFGALFFDVQIPRICGRPPSEREKGEASSVRKKHSSAIIVADVKRFG